MTADGLDTYALHMFTLEGGKIKSFTAFDDTDSMRSSMIEWFDGAIAQLGERLAGSEKVVGSIPSSSTI